MQQSAQQLYLYHNDPCTIQVNQGLTSGMIPLNNLNHDEVDVNNIQGQCKRPALSCRNTTTTITTTTITTTNTNTNTATSTTNDTTTNEGTHDFNCPVANHKSDTLPPQWSKSSTTKSTNDMRSSQLHPYLRNMAALKQKQKFSLDHFDNNRRVIKSTTHHQHASHRPLKQPHQSTPTFYNAYLQPNAQFIGEQQSGKSKFRIKVEFKTVDLKNSLVTGFLQINGLTKDHQEIVTYFRGEIINNPLFSQQQQSSSSSSGLSTTYNDEYKRYSFMAENKSWGSSTENDLDHWQRLTGRSSPIIPTFPTLPYPAYSTCPYAAAAAAAAAASGATTTTTAAHNSSFSISRSRKSHEQSVEFMNKLAKIYRGQCQDDTDNNHQYIYMRWKEEFLLPDSRVKQIPNASFEGFYYIVLNIGDGRVMDQDNLDMDMDMDTDIDKQGNYSKTNSGTSGSKPGDINGLYYHISSEKFQSLSLNHVDNHGVSSTFDFN